MEQAAQRSNYSKEKQLLRKESVNHTVSLVTATSSNDNGTDMI